MIENEGVSSGTGKFDCRPWFLKLKCFYMLFQGLNFVSVDERGWWSASLSVFRATGLALIALVATTERANIRPSHL